MCGLVGIINRGTNKLESDKLIKVFNQSLYCGVLRGLHGTGILGVDSAGGATYYKKALPSYDFIELTKAKAIINANNTFLCGHNRYATQGSHTAENAHPFYHGNIVMFHNGTLDSWKWMAPDKKFSVDSEYLVHYISKSTNIAETLEEIEGAYSLVWYNSLEKTLNFARNKDRPMFFGIIKGSESLIYASEEGMIEWLASRNGIELLATNTTEIGKLISIPLDPKLKTKVRDFTPKPEELKWAGYYKYPQKSNIIFESKNSKLVGTKEVLVKIDSWEAYNETTMTNRWGKLFGKYKDTIIRVPSINELVKDKYIGKDVIVNITSATDKEIYGALVRIANEDDLILDELLKIEEKEDILLSDCKTCNNCNDMILPSEIKDCTKDSDGSLYCADCAINFNKLAVL